jgi:hypothetical protein
LILNDYFTVSGGKIGSLIVIRNTPAYEDILPADVLRLIRHYFALDAERAIDSIVALFTDDAAVIDERETRHGTAQIRAWQTGPASKYTYTTEVLGTDALAANRYVVPGRLTGNFLGRRAEMGLQARRRSNQPTDHRSLRSDQVDNPQSEGRPIMSATTTNRDPGSRADHILARVRAIPEGFVQT